MPRPEVPTPISTTPPAPSAAPSFPTPGDGHAEASQVSRWVIPTLLAGLAPLLYILWRIEVEAAGVAASGPGGDLSWGARLGTLAFELAGLLGLIVLIYLATRSLRTDKRTVHRMEWMLLESNSLLRAVVDGAPVMIWVADVGLQRTFCSKPWLDFTGRPIESELGEGWAQALHPEDSARCLALFRDSFDQRRPFIAEYRLQRHDGAYRWVLDAAAPRLSPDGAFQGYIGSCIDITERREAEQRLRSTEEQLRQSLQHQQHLLQREHALRRELDHRVRNNLASLASLVRLYARSGRGAPEVSSAILGKVSAMKEAHDIISRNLGVPIEVSAVIQKAVGALLPDGRQHALDASGPPVMVRGEQVGALAMVLQELVTNASKYGSLRAADGRIEISWVPLVAPALPHTDDHDPAPHDHLPEPPPALGFQLTWRETGGPAPVEPNEFGVGLRLIEGFARSELRGDCSFHFLPAGFVCELRVMPYQSSPDFAASLQEAQLQ